ncbi:unnamed protein product [Spirodela intermedia]|uniref:GPI-anchored protein LLG1-like domain-containing protein n=2 Tax=Spirodela intermedia TaxID=51605 RepID=A0A7I8IKK3_SPIIN|nr:unnamed protein product [Spirodela intermedia]CAA6658413.1 unnamed protein product [Spirodela intermedia]CAA7394669.1 unnamed protein product [Spirodela intermedia]
MRRDPFLGGAGCRLPAILFIFLRVAAAASSAAFISDGALGSGISGAAGGRALLQAKKSCPISFEFKNYMIITSQCKGPRYPPKLCCTAFMEFACPYAEQLNDPTNDCATTMFSYINLYGSYPPGLFASECKDSKRGLECVGVPASTDDVQGNTSAAAAAAAAAALVVAIPAMLSFFLVHLMIIS